MTVFTEFDKIDKKYDVIYADPPFSYNNQATRASSDKHYLVMKMWDIQALNVANIAKDNALLFIWVPFPLLIDLGKIFSSWGFEYKGVAFTWIKTNKDGSPFVGLGNYTRANAEVCLLGTRGKGTFLVKNHSISSIFMSRREQHSKKPDLIRRRIEDLVGVEGDWIELFATHKSHGWDQFGNDVK